MKAIVSVIGHDKKGIIADVSSLLCEMSINIEDISQTIMQNHFTMIMVVSLEEASLPFDQIATKLDQLGKKLEVEIRIQLESIFNSMHKI